MSIFVKYVDYEIIIIYFANKKMKDSRLLSIFQALSSKEIRALEKFVHSPYHNQRTDVILLYDYLRQFVQNPTTISCQKSIIFPYIFPNEPYAEKKIRYTMSFLYQVIKDFLAIQAFQSDPITIQIAVVKAYRKKGVTHLFEQELKATTTLLEKTALRNQTYYFQNYLLQNERYLFTTSQTRGEAVGLIEAAEHLDQFFIISKLRQSAEILSHQSLDNAQFKPNFLTEVLAFLDKNGTENNPAIAIYYHCYQVLAEAASLPYFQNLRQLIATYSPYFPTRELQDIYSFAINYCIKRLNAQDLPFGREALILYKEGLQQQIFFENGILSRFNYKNIVALGLGLKEFDYVAEFIERYKPYLEKKYRESTYCYNLALLHYRTANYGKAMELLQQVSTKDVFNNLTARRMLVIIYYDQGDFEALYSLLDSFQNYVYRKSGLGYHRKLYLNFIKFTRKLLQLEGMTTAQIQALHAEISAARNVAEKDWLLGKIVT